MSETGAPAEFEHKLRDGSLVTWRDGWTAEYDFWFDVLLDDNKPRIQLDWWMGLWVVVAGILAWVVTR